MERGKQAKDFAPVHDPLNEWRHLGSVSDDENKALSGCRVTALQDRW